MVIKQDTLQEICSLAARQVQDLYPTLQVAFIPHAQGMFQQVVATGDYNIRRHPAAQTAKNILEKNNNREQSGFLGIAIAHQVKWYGFASSDHVLALFNINTDEFMTTREARRDIYHLLWHAIDLFKIRHKPEYYSKFRSGPMIPKRSPMNLTRLNLEADVFSTIMCGLQGEEDALESLAQMRASTSLTASSALRAEDYPYVIALEAAQYAYTELQASHPMRTKYMALAAHITNEVGKAFDDESIKQWWGFAEPAQDMAWRGYSGEIILGCAINTSENPFVRAIGHLVGDISGIEPISDSKLHAVYNPFASSEANLMLHREMMEKTFDDAIRNGIREESGQPLLSAANAQNEGLLTGAVLGWCANALQAAARAFDSARASGMSPLQAARMEFEGTKDMVEWDALRKVGDSVIEERRKGYGLTLASLAELCNAAPLFAPILNSLRMTMREPAYGYAPNPSLGLALGAEFENNAVMPMPSFVPQMAPAAPVMGFAPSGPGGMPASMPQRAPLTYADEDDIPQKKKTSGGASEQQGR